MRKIVAYKILHGGAHGQLEEMVLKLINEGWECLGGSFGGRIDAISFDLFQTMVKYE